MNETRKCEPKESCIECHYKFRCEEFHDWWWKSRPVESESKNDS